jgi:thiol-disulfide isomerase/thioredoxin
MRTVIRTLALAALCCSYIACQTVPEELFPEQTRLTATIEAEPDTRTAISPSGEHSSSIIWSEGDELSVFIDGATQAVPFKLSEGAGTKKGVFSGKGGGNSYVAFYPSSMIPSRGTGTLRLTLPSEQTYSPGTFSPGAYPMVAVSDSPELHFRNIASVIRLSITGHHEVTRIVFRSNDPETKVSGKSTVSLSDPSRPELTMVSGAVDSMVLTVPRVKLDEKAATDFFLVVPPQTYRKGFTVRIYTDERFMDKVYSSSFTTVRSLMHKSDPFVFTPNGSDISTFLEGSGTDSDPFLIQSLPDLIYMRDAVNAGAGIMTASGSQSDAYTASYRMTADIDLSPVCGRKTGKSWTPIGDDAHQFMGRFDGDWHSVTGLYINSGKSDQGLFGVIVAGCLISNLTVTGEVTSSGNNVSLLSGRFENMLRDWTVYNCTAEGSVKGGSNVGGICGGGNYFQAYNCINRANVTGNSSVGGIAGRTYWSESNCVNYGNISGSSDTGGIVGMGSGTMDNCSNFGTVQGGWYTGGIAGYQNSGRLTDCLNEGTVSGTINVGGLSGYSRQGSSVWNNVNKGKVSGQDKVGGICGYLSYSAGESSLKNCVNLGMVELSSSSGYAGAICGRSEGEYGSSGASQCTVEQNYWLYDAGKGLGMETGIGLDEGISGSNYPLTEARMKGAACDQPLYQGFRTIVDALNGWAFDQRDNMELQGWRYQAGKGYPELTGLPASAPGEDNVVFAISINEVELLGQGGGFVVEVRSSAGYTVQTPGWISETSVQGYEADPFTRQHSFKVSYNDSGGPRSGAVVFKNDAGSELKVSVKQKDVYLELGKEELLFSGEESTKSISVSSSIAWNVESDSDWCTLPSKSGLGDGVISVHAAANPSKSARSARITVSSDDGSLVRTVAVLQSGASEGGSEVDWTTHEFVHKSVAMRFTATWCGWCPRMNKSIRQAQELYPDKISYVAIHSSDSDLAFGAGSALFNQFMISGIPSGIIDCRTMVTNQDISVTANNIVNAVKETEQKYGTVTGVEINSSVSGRVAQVDVGVYVKKAGDYKITVLLLEDGIVNAQSDYEEGDHPRYVHDCVARVAMSNVKGDSFKVDRDNSVVDFSFSANVPSSYNLGNMHVLVYVQRTFKPYQVIQSGSYGDYFVDNSAEVALGENLRLALVGGGGGGSSSGGGDNEGIKPGDDIDM